MAFLVVEQRTMNVMNVVNIQEHLFADVETQDVDQVEESEGSPQTWVKVKAKVLSKTASL